MPRLTPERREARRAQIVAAARRCFSRDGFHQTSMPDIAAEAGLSPGASYRYFSSKEDIIIEIAGQAFATMFAPLDEHLVEQGRPPTVADLVATAIAPVSGETTRDAAGQPVPVDELLRCAVQSWAELLRHDELRQRAAAGIDSRWNKMAEALRRGQQAGAVPADLDPKRGTRVLMALLHGFVLQRTAFGLDDTEGFIQDVRTVLTDLGPVNKRGSRSDK
jgi:AcrR family transcriptional regulator